MRLKSPVLMIDSNAMQVYEKKKEKTTPLGVIQEKLMVNPSFPLAMQVYPRVLTCSSQLTSLINCCKSEPWDALAMPPVAQPRQSA